MTRHDSILLLLITSLSGAWGSGVKAEETLLDTFAADVRPVMEALCFDCHGPDKAKGDIRLDTLNPDLVKGPDAETWLDALDQINLGEMPPKKSTQPNSTERKVLVSWMNASLRTAAEAMRFADGRVVSRRLTRYEYANTMRDLLGVEMDYGRELPPDPASPEGFLNNGATLEMSATQIETHLAIARQALAAPDPVHPGRELAVWWVGAVCPRLRGGRSSTGARAPRGDGCRE